MPLFRELRSRLPDDSWTALRYEAVSNIGSGAYLMIFSVSMAAIKSILKADLIYLAVLAISFLGSSLLSPIVPWVGRRVPMRSLVVVPNVIVGVLLMSLLLRSGSPDWFTGVMAATFILRVFPRVSEMNMYRVLYPDSDRGRVVGLLRAVAGLAGLATTLTSFVWFRFAPEWYAGLYFCVGVLMLISAASYSRIPVPAQLPPANGFAHPAKAFWEGLRVFLADRRFLVYEIGFAIAGIANHIGLMLVPEVLKETLNLGTAHLTFLVAVLPAILIIVFTVIWARWVDGKTPMYARAVFNAFQTAAYLGYAIGGLTGQVVWFYLGTTCHAISNGGGNINWLTGSLYFAPADRVPLYNTIHVGLTGLRGLVGPVIGYLLFTGESMIGSVTVHGLGWGAGTFLVCAGLSITGTVILAALHRVTSAAQSPVEVQPA